MVTARKETDMPSKKKQPPPLFAVKHDFVDSLDAFIQASIMLHNAVTSALSLTNPGQPLPNGVRDILQERALAWSKATLTDGDESGG